MLSKGLLYGSLLSLVAPALGGVQSKLNAVPKGWSAASKTSDSTSITLSIGLARQNIDQLEAKLLAVSTPGNALYGQYLDDATVNKLFAPSSAAVSSVTAWLKSHGIKNINVDGAWIDFSTTVGTANTLLGASYKFYQSEGVTKLRTLAYEVPDELEAHIDLVEPSTYFGKTQAFRAIRSTTEEEAPAKRAVDPSCEQYITPACLKEMYNVGGYTPDPKSGSRVGFGSFLNYSAQYADIALFEQRFNIPSQGFSVVTINGGVNGQSPDYPNVGEADLDAEYMIAMAHPLPVTEFITGGSPPFVPNIDQPTPADNFNEPYVPYYRYLLSQPKSKLPQVISNSYGDEEDSVPYNYAKATCDMIGLMGLRGISILESSGDLGVGAGCLAPDYKTVEFNAIFPATCPYITSVGGTIAVSPEVAWNGSSGGFSKYFKRPAYQDKAVLTYLSKVSPSTKRYYGQYTDFSGRGFPDIAAHSLTPWYEVVFSGKLTLSGGTSAASPTLAGLIALLNDARLRAHKPALGFLNPLIYGLAYKVLNDITSGYSVGCEGVNTQTGGTVTGGGVVPGARWNATVGWDPVTGYGTPNFQALKNLVLKI